MKIRRLVVVGLAIVAGAVFSSQALAGAPSSPGAVTVIGGGNGNGLVSSGGFPADPWYVNCSIVNGVAQVIPGSDCQTATLNGGDLVWLSATPSAGSIFVGWAGCPSLGPTANVCTFTVDGNITVQAVFVSSRVLTVSKTGTGQGTVTSNPAGINCGSACIASFTPNSLVSLTATAASGSVFAGWAGACAPAGLNPVCTVSMAVNEAVTAIFNARPASTLTVTTAGSGQGTVTSSPPGLSCPPTCVASVVAGTTVTLTATPAQGSEFQGWSGACTGTGTCSITPTAATSVTATFGPAQVQAMVEGTFFRKNGPKAAKRRLYVNVNAEEQVRVTLQLRRSGIILASKTIVRFGPGDRNLVLPVRNAIASGRAQLRVIFTDQFGNQKTQNRSVRVPKLT